MSDINKKYMHKRRLGYWLLGLGMMGLLAVLVVVAVSVGAMDLGLIKTQQILTAKLTGNPLLLAQFRPNEVAIVWEIRLPRILCGILVGAGLAVAGVIFQSLLRNPLADPYTLGVSTGAAFGASLAILLNVTFGLMISTTWMAFGFAFVTLLVVLLIASRGGGLISTNLIIAGIIVSAILSSGISFIKMVAGEDVSAIVFWLMGSLCARGWAEVGIVAPIVAIATVVAFIFADDLNVLTMGEENARALGVNTRRINLLYLILGASLTAACVAVSGIIGFIGLVVPHILRFWQTSNNRVLIPLAALMGGLILAVADNLTRLLPAGEIPVGVLTTLIGGPFFIYIFISRQNR